VSLYTRLPRPVEWHVRRCQRLESLLWCIAAGTLVINIMLALMFAMMISELALFTLLSIGGACWAAHRAKQWTKVLRWEELNGRRNAR
jgi:hypothetical protein